MNKFRLFGAIFLASILAGGTCFAGETAWQIRESHGLVRVQQTAGGVHKASLQESLEPGASLTTGGDGRVVLSNGKQQIVVGPNSRMTVPAESKSGFTHVLQDLGTLLFKVDKRPTQHFEVDTPMIAAVVKGTTFTVTVGADYAEVHVAEGLVEVKTPDGLGHSMVPSGVTAIVSKSNPSKIEIHSPSATTPSSQSASKTIVPANTAKGQTASIPADLGPGQPDFDRLTNGLLQSSEHSNGNSDQGLLRAQTSVDLASANPQAVPSASVHSQLGPSVNEIGNANAGGSNANGNGSANAGGANANAGGTNGSTNANANAGGANANANAGGTNANANANAGGVNGSTNANANAGGTNANANAGGTNANANANANAGGTNANANANANSGGVNANANAGGVNANVNANANAGGVNASVNAGGVGVSVSTN
jgi:hypothetical protein